MNVVSGQRLSAVMDIAQQIRTTKTLSNPQQYEWLLQESANLAELAAITNSLISPKDIAAAKYAVFRDELASLLEVVRHSAYQARTDANAKFKMPRRPGIVLASYTHMSSDNDSFLWSVPIDGSERTVNLTLSNARQGGIYPLKTLQRNLHAPDSDLIFIDVLLDLLKNQSSDNFDKNALVGQ